MAQGRDEHERLDEGSPRLTVAMVCVPGGIYGASHVERLLGQVSTHLDGYETHVIWESDKPGWWAKIDLFEPGRFTGRVLYLDLDVAVVGDLNELAWYDTFCAIRDYQFPLTINSSVMAWDAGVADHIYTDFNDDVMRRYRGDQNYINTKIHARRFPMAWCPSYRAHCRDGVPEGARVIVYHGQPKPWDLDGSSLN